MLGWVRKLFGKRDGVPHKDIVDYLRGREYATQQELVEKFGAGVVDALKELENRHSIVVSMFSPGGDTLYRLSRWYRRNVLKEEIK